MLRRPPTAPDVVSSRRMPAVVALAIAAALAAAVIGYGATVGEGSEPAGGQVSADAALAVRSFEALRGAGSRYAFKIAQDGASAASSPTGTAWQQAISEAMRAERELSTSAELSREHKDGWHDAVVRVTSAVQLLEEELDAAEGDSVLIEQALDRFDGEVVAGIEDADGLVADMSAGAGDAGGEVTPGAAILLGAAAGLVAGVALAFGVGQLRSARESLAGEIAFEIEAGLDAEPGPAGEAEPAQRAVVVSEPEQEAAAEPVAEPEPEPEPESESQPTPEPESAPAPVAVTVEDHLAAMIAALISVTLTDSEEVAGALHLAFIEPGEEPPDWMAMRREHWDGSGEHGLRGDAIPFRARIAAVADAVATELVDRPAADVGDRLAEMAGEQLDPRLVVLVRHLEEQGLLDGAIAVMGREQPPAGGLPTAAAIRELCRSTESAQAA